MLKIQVSTSGDQPLDPELPGLACGSLPTDPELPILPCGALPLGQEPEILGLACGSLPWDPELPVLAFWSLTVGPEVPVHAGEVPHCDPRAEPGTRQALLPSDALAQLCLNGWKR